MALSDTKINHRAERVQKGIRINAEEGHMEGSSVCGLSVRSVTLTGSVRKKTENYYHEL